MIHALTDPTFYNPALFGLLGIALWIFVTWVDPTDDTISGSLKVVARHTRPLVIGLVSYLMLCVILHRQSELTDAMACFAAYTNHSLVVKIFDTMAARHQAKLGAP